MATTNTVAALTPDRQQVQQFDGFTGGEEGTSPSWTQIGGAANGLYGGGHGLVATDAAQRNILLYRGTPGNWQQISAPGEALAAPGAAFAVTGNAVFGLTPDRQSVWQYDDSGTSWTQIGGAASGIYGGDNGLVATDATQAILLYTGTPGNWQQIGGPGAEFTVTGNAVYGLTQDRQQVQQYAGTGWKRCGGPASEIVACQLPLN